MIFINLVAEIIHECCDFYDGSINKNIGDAFLLVWKYKKNYCLNKKFSNQEYTKTGVTSYEYYSEKKKINRICDLAFLSTIKTLIKLKQVMMCYCTSYVRNIWYTYLYPIHVYL